MTYDSKAEEKAAKFFEPLGYRRPADYEYIDSYLIDSSGKPFNAKVDFIPTDPSDCTVEFKTGDLNSRRIKADADAALHKARNSPYRQKTDHYLVQQYAWSNSAHKHAIQHYALPPLTHITVFSTWPTYEAIKVYNKLGILWCHIDDFSILNSYCKAVRAGLPINYIQRTPDGQQITFPLQAIMQWQATHSKWKQETASRKEWDASGFQSAKQKKRRK